MQSLTWARAAAWRVHRHHLEEHAPGGALLAVASRLCGLHAQVMSGAELAAWARVQNLDRGAVPRALWEDRTLIKTWAMRGTLHLLPAAELPLWRAALSISPRYLREAAWKKYFGITLAELDRITEAIAEALVGRILTREQLIADVAERTGSAAFAAALAESSWGTILKPAAFSGRLCFAPSIGTRVCFTHPDTWLASAEQTPGGQVDAKTASAAIARHYLATYGPVTYHDLARWWNGGGLSTARQWIASLGDEACQVELDGTGAWMLRKDLRELRQLPPSRSVRLLPGFDQYVVSASCYARSLLPGDLRARVFRPQGWISPVLLVKGQMLGIWRHEMRNSRVDVTIEPFVSLPQWAKRAAGGEAERLAAYFGCKLNLAWKF